METKLTIVSLAFVKLDFQKSIKRIFAKTFLHAIFTFYRSVSAVVVHFDTSFPTVVSVVRCGLCNRILCCWLPKTDRQTQSQNGLS